MAGCPQGSVLGPLLALIYLNDLSDKTKNDALFYADDTSLYLSHPPESQRHRQSLQTDLDMIKQFGTDWAITFNIDKTVQQTFTNRHTNQNLTLTFNGQAIPSATTHKHLGLTFSTDLHFHQHINKIISRAAESESEPESESVGIGCFSRSRSRSRNRHFFYRLRPTPGKLLFPIHRNRHADYFGHFCAYFCGKLAG